MTRSTLRGRAAVLGTATVLVAALCFTVAAPVAAGSASVVGPVTVPRGGTSATAASVVFAETLPNEFPNGPFSITVAILDASYGATVTFDQTGSPSLSKPDSVQATVAWAGASSFTITGTASSTGQVESMAVGNLRVKATAGAALGSIITTYSTTGLPAGIFDAQHTASGALSAAAASGVSSLSVTMDPGSPNFITTGANAGNLFIGTGGANPENKPVTSATFTTVTLTTATSFAHVLGERVTQTQTATPGWLPSIGSVPGIATGISVTASGPTTVYKGVADQAVGSVIITETAGHPLTAGQVIHVSAANDPGLGTPGATFVGTPTVAANTVASGITATIQNVTSTGFDVKVGAAASGLTGGQLTISGIRMTVRADASTGSLQLSVLGTTVAVATVAASSTTTLLLTAFPGTSVAPNGAVTLRAQFSVAVAGLPIVFQAKPTGATVFTTIGTVNTNSSGYSDLPITVPVTTTYQAVFAGSGGLQAATSAPVTVTVTAVPTLTLQIAAGYKTSLTTPYGTAVSVPNGKYVTLKVNYGVATPNVAVKFYQRIGKTGAWTFLSTGRTDAAGVVVWSKVVKVPAGATGYGRYVYFKVTVDLTPSVTLVSNAVRAVAK
jgi:large repetitive protein